MVKPEDVKEALKKIARKKLEEEKKDVVAVHYSELAKYLQISPVYALTWLRTVCEEIGRYVNGKCVIYTNDME
ncbi:MAG: hypothetical protein C0179_04440 [Fervidicoccus sp.]|jgi:hypothetical protein|nr:MAG: hypothetical protein C0179_04440 [Fervidicoccus sp.]